MDPLGPFKIKHVLNDLKETFLFATPRPSYFLNAENTINNIHR